MKLMKKPLRYITALLLVSVFVISSFGADSVGQGSGSGTASSPVSASPATVDSKTEVVYATLSAAGSVNAIYTVNQFDVSGAGSITDYGNYSSVINLTDTGEILLDGEIVTALAGSDIFYYQGNMASTDLPWVFDISYKLDGAAIAPEALSGKSGELEITIDISPNENISSVFADNYLLQVSVTLDSEKCRHIQAPDASMASAGKNRMANYTVLPGGNATLTLKASVTDFSMPGIDISGIPYSMSMDIPGLDDMLEEFDLLVDAVSELNDGVSEFADGISELRTGAGKLAGGSGEIMSGLKALSGNSAQLTDGSAQISGALSQISGALSSGATEDFDVSGLMSLGSGLAEMAAGLEQISAGLKQLKEGFSPAYAALDSAIESIPEATLTEQDIAALYAQTNPTLHGTIDALAANYAAAQTVKGTYEQVKAAFAAVDTTLDTIIGSIDAVSTGLGTTASAVDGALAGMGGLEQLGQLGAALSELSASYAAFHTGLVEYTDGINTLANNYSSFNSGVAELNGGIRELDSGADELSDGVSRLNDEVSKLPGTIETEISKLMGGDEESFEPVSFVSDKNKNVELVQFVLKTEGIEAASDNTGAPQTIEVKETFIDRLRALFS